MKLHKTHGRATTRRRDPMRWKVAALVALALLGIGAMHTHVLMFRSGEDVLSALVETGGMIMIAAIPIGYLVYRLWFAEHPLMKPLKGFTADAGFDKYDMWEPQDNGLPGYEMGTSIGVVYGWNSDDDYSHL